MWRFLFSLSIFLELSVAATAANLVLSGFSRRMCFQPDCYHGYGNLAGKWTVNVAILFAVVTAVTLVTMVTVVRCRSCLPFLNVHEAQSVLRCRVLDQLCGKRKKPSFPGTRTDSVTEAGTQSAHSLRWKMYLQNSPETSRVLMEPAEFPWN